MSKHLGATEAFQLLDNLRATVRDITGRASRLSEEFRQKLVREQKRREAAIEEHHQRSAAADNAEETNFATTRSELLSNFERRKTRIGKAYQSSKEQRLKEIDDRVGARKYELQKKMLQAERDRQAALAAAATATQEFKSNLAAQQEALAGLELAAQKTFSGYGSFSKIFKTAYQKTAPDVSADEHGLLSQLKKSLHDAQEKLARLKKSLFVALFRYLPPWLTVVLCAGVIALLVLQMRVPLGSGLTIAIAGAGILAIILRFVGAASGRPLVQSISDSLAAARRLHDVCGEKADAHYQQQVQQCHVDFQNTTQSVDQQLKQALADAGQARVACRMASDEKTVRITARHEQHQRAKIAALERGHDTRGKALKADAETQLANLVQASKDHEQKVNAEFQSQWKALETEWTTKLTPIYERIKTANLAADQTFPPWSQINSTQWNSPARFEQAARFAEFGVDVDKLAEVARGENKLPLPGPSQFSVPMSLLYPEEGSVLFETTDSGREQVMSALNNIILRLLSISPPGRLNFSIIDPVGLGQGFAGVMHLADYEEQIINSRIWTQSGQIEQRLADLNEHMEKVIQMYLRNEYQTIAEYNEQAGVIAEKYHFLVVADFPSNFSDTAAKRLMSIATSGARCGVYMLIHWDRRQPLPQDFVPDELRKGSVCITCRGNEFMLTGKFIPGAQLRLDAPPSPEQATEFVHQVGRKSRDSSRVEVPFEHVAPAPAEIWSEDTTSELRVPIGRTGATKLQYLAIGKGTCQHGLIAGKTGSGKSTLFHVIITNLALWCSPEQVEFYLVDFKKGVEFKCYASRRLPHARVVAIESDREFGLSVLQRIDDELKRRGDMFRKLGVQDIAGYKRAGGTEPIPRTLLMVDEFQEFFVEDDKVSQTASLLLDRIVRQGRAFGIHVLLGSQTLGGAYTVARTTLGQMVIRIALQSNEADAYLIMDDSNPAPRLLSRPGEGIYNDTAGTVQGNSPFQAVWLADEVRDSYLAKIRTRADQNGGNYPGPIVFEGNAPADVRENLQLRALLEADSVRPAAAGRIWLGAPNSIKGPTEAVFHRQSGNNLMIVGQRDEAALAMVSIALVSLAAQYPVGAARFILLDSNPPGSPHREYLERVVQAIPHKINLARQSELGAIMKNLVDEMKQRTDDEQGMEAPPAFLFIHGLQKYSKLRYEEDFGFSSPDADAEPNPALLLNSLLSEGTRLGFHVIATCDSYNNVNRFLNRKAFSEFEMRVLFQMSANDSASLIDNPKASTLGLHRALYYNEQEGHLETFRPYALPGSEWLEQVQASLRRLLEAEVVRNP